MSDSLIAQNSEMTQGLLPIRGVIPILQTAFCDDGSLDLNSLYREVQFARESGARAVVFPGFGSEWWKLSGEEILRCAKVIASACDNSTMFIANVTAQSRYTAVGQTEAFLRLGASAIMCLLPSVFPLTEEAAINHLRAILSVERVPMILQYTDSSTTPRFAPDRLVSLHKEYSNFCCMKLDFSPACTVLTELVRAFSGLQVTFIAGFAGLHLPELMTRGALGFMPGTGYLPTCIHVFRDLQHNPHSGRVEFERLLPLISFEMQTIEFSIALHKWLLREFGVIKSDHVRPPGLQIDRFQRAELKRFMKMIRSRSDKNQCV